MWWKKKKQDDKMIALLHDEPSKDISSDAITTWIINEIDRIHTDLFVHEKTTTPFQYPPKVWETSTRFDTMERLLQQLKESGVKHNFRGINKDFYSKSA